MDLLYVQMEEHSRKLSLFSNMFDCASETVGVEAEFLDSMEKLKLFDQAVVDNFLKLKKASAKGIRSQSAGPPSQLSQPNRLPNK